MFENLKEKFRLEKLTEGEILIINDFIDYFKSARENKIIGLKLSHDRELDIGVIDFCNQSLTFLKEITGNGRRQ